MIQRLALAYGKFPDEVREQDSSLITEGLALDRVIGIPDFWKAHSELMSWIATGLSGKVQKPENFTPVRKHTPPSTAASVRSLFAGLAAKKAD